MRIRNSLINRYIIHYGTVGRGAKRPLGLWVSNGYDHTQNTPFLNIGFLGKFRGRLYQHTKRM